jgi:hypothetical protein
MYTPSYGREFLRGVEKAIFEGFCASASFDAPLIFAFFLRGKAKISGGCL